MSWPYEGNAVTIREREFEDQDGDFQQWTVMAVLVDAEKSTSLPAGVVVAADLDLAAGQVSRHLPALPSGACYLVATPCEVEVDRASGHLRTMPKTSWVSRLWREEAGWAWGEWVPVPRDLPERWPGSPACRHRV